MKGPPVLDSRLMEIPPPEGTMLRLVHNMGLLRQIMDPYFVQFCISSPQWGILRVLQRAYDSGEISLPQKEISRRLLIQPPSVTALVDRLERMGLLHRGSSDDLRVRMVALTDAGRKMIADVQEKHPDQIRSLFSGFSPSELEDFHALLGKLGTHLALISARSQSPTNISANSAKAKPHSQRSSHTK